ncbi:PilN domain-containing protein [Candidatus Aerophobetes bacterium]|nr:PilN domain-containing protein [Candidatus Aerophobetes bacterium]
MIKINLLPLRIREQREKRDFVIFVGICAVCALVICYLFYLSLNQSVHPLEEKLTELKNKITEHQPTLTEIERIKAENIKLQARFNVFHEVVTKQSFWPRFFYSIYRSLPDTIWLEEIKGEAGQNFVEIKGKSLNKTVGVAEFIKNLENSKLFSEIVFTKFAQQEMFGREVMFFQIRCFISKDGESK